MSLRIVFMGTPDFAVPCLENLLLSSHEVVAVFSQPDRPKGRGKKLAFPPVKELALNHHIPVYQPHSLRDGEALHLIQELNPDVIVVVAYGKILPKELLALPPYGCINVHGSLLPKLRGAAPIQWSILRGDRTTGITTMYMGEGLDTGDMILQKETPILPEETSGELFDRLAPMGAQLLMETLEQVEHQTAPRIPQKEEEATYAPIITKEMGLIDFSKSPEEVCNLVRGMSPWPSAYTFLGDLRVIVHQAVVVPQEAGAAGEILNAKKLIVGCGKSAIQLLEVQPQGKKRVDGSSFANGRRLQGGEFFTSTPLANE